MKMCIRDSHYIQDVNVFFEKIKNNEKGFRLYDIFFIDYSLSSGIVGRQLITDSVSYTHLDVSKRQVYMRRLRMKIEDNPSEPQMLLTVRRLSLIHI